MSADVLNGSVSERRGSARYPLELEAELSSCEVRLSGTTANIGSGGLLMTCDRNVAIGSIVTVRMNWPVRQGDKQVVLVVQGEIIRRERSRVAILRRQYDFEVC